MIGLTGNRDAGSSFPARGSSAVDEMPGFVNVGGRPTGPLQELEHGTP